MVSEAVHQLQVLERGARYPEAAERGMRTDEGRLAGKLRRPGAACAEESRRGTRAEYCFSAAGWVVQAGDGPVGASSVICPREALGAGKRLLTAVACMQTVKIHPSSTLADKKVGAIVYDELVRGVTGAGSTRRPSFRA